LGEMSYPIVLAHGVCRFDRLWCNTSGIDSNNTPKLDRFHYFKGLRTELTKHGFTVYHSNVSWAGSVETRAKQLKENINTILKKEKVEKVNIIAHSMGGLDARHMLFKFRDSDRLHERIASLTTISTPHNGSSFADWGTDHLSLAVSVTQKLGLNLNGLKDLRTDQCHMYNNRPDVIEFEKFCEKKIIFQTFAGKQNFWGISEPLKLSFYIIKKKEGDNDGLVSVQSAKWKDHYFKGVLENTDHLNELGWWSPSQFLEWESNCQLLKRIHNFYINIARQLP
jgi:triacylglycerol lipase